MTTLPKHTTEHALLRENLLDGAIAAGKLSPSHRDQLAALFDVNPQYATLLVAKMAPGATTLAATVAKTPALSQDPYDPSWLSPAERARLSASQAQPDGARVINLHD
jgi:hypothetical protein